MSTQAMKRVALHNWRKDGCPDRDRYEPTSVGRGDYEREAKAVITGLLELGYTIKAPKRRAAAPAAQDQGEGK